MRAKDYARGLKFFENRISREAAIVSQNKIYPNLAANNRLWKGENIKNKTVMAQSLSVKKYTQSLLQFVRFAWQIF